MLPSLSTLFSATILFLLVGRTQASEPPSAIPLSSLPLPPAPAAGWRGEGELGESDGVRSSDQVWREHDEVQGMSSVRGKPVGLLEPISASTLREVTYSEVSLPFRCGQCPTPDSAIQVLLSGSFCPFGQEQRLTFSQEQRLRTGEAEEALWCREKRILNVDQGGPKEPLTFIRGSKIIAVNCMAGLLSCRQTIP